MTDLQKNYVPSKTKDVNVKVFHIKRINKVKTLVKHISCDCKCKYGSTTCNFNMHICENSRYLKSIVDN